MRRVLLRFFDAQQRYKIVLQLLDILLQISKSAKNIAKILNVLSLGSPERSFTRSDKFLGQLSRDSCINRHHNVLLIFLGLNVKAV